MPDWPLLKAPVDRITNAVIEQITIVSTNTSTTPQMP
jgi:hypothetical protein